jgi:transposase
VEKQLAKIAAGHPGMTLLMTVPGIGIRTAEAFLAYVDDVRRFARSRQVGAYFGLVPRLDSSAGKDRFGHITRDGPPTVRKLLCEAAWVAVRRDPRIRARFDRIVNGDPDRRKIAIVAIAHHAAHRRSLASGIKNGSDLAGNMPPQQAVLLTEADLRTSLHGTAASRCRIGV